MLLAPLCPFTYFCPDCRTSWCVWVQRTTSATLAQLRRGLTVNEMGRAA